MRDRKLNFHVVKNWFLNLSCLSKIIPSCATEAAAINCVYMKWLFYNHTNDYNITKRKADYSLLLKTKLIIILNAVQK